MKVGKVSEIQKELFYLKYNATNKKKKEVKKPSIHPKMDTVEISSEARHLYKTKKDV